MSSDSWWAADSHLLIGFANEVSDANKQLWNPTPVIRTASIPGNLSSSCKKVYNHRSDHVPPWAISLITYLAIADPPSLLWSHWSISPGKERGRQNTKQLLRDGGGGTLRTTTFTALADSMSRLGRVSPLDDIILQPWASKRLDAGVWLGQSLGLTMWNGSVSCNNIWNHNKKIITSYVLNMSYTYGIYKLLFGLFCTISPHFTRLKLS